MRKNWKKLNTKYDSYFEGGVYGHSIHLMKKRGTKFSDPYHKADVEDTHISLNDKDKLNIEVFMEGILIFGGFNSLDKATNRVLFLHLGSNPVTLSEIFPKGEPPSPRGYHNMVYLKHLGYLVIYGGRNDANFAKRGLISLSDMAL